MFLDGIVDQLQGESLHLAFLALVGGVSTAAAVIGWLIRRDTRRTDAERAQDRLRIEALSERLDDHVRRSGFETSDIKNNLNVLVAELRYDNPKLTIPQWPSR